MGVRVGVAALLGAVCAIGWNWSLPVATTSLCDMGADDWQCIGVYFLLMPVLLIVWVGITWALLKYARFRPAWKIALGGPAIALPLVYLLGLLGGALGIYVVHWRSTPTLAAAMAAGYALVTTLSREEQP